MLTKRHWIIYTKGDQSWPRSEIFTIDTALQNEQRLTFDELRDCTPSFSPDDRMIIWEKKFNIYVMDADGTNQRRITYGRYPSWAPDSDFFIFSHLNNDYSREVIWRMDIDGQNKTQLTF